MFKHSDTKNKAFNFGGMLCLAATAYLIYYLLLKDTFLPFSVTSVLNWSEHETKLWHIFAVGLIPIYLAFVIFGAGVISVTLGSAMQRWLLQLLKIIKVTS